MTALGLRFGSRRIAAASLAAAGLLLGLATIATPASAQQQPGTINPEQACRDDAFKLCNDFIPDRDKVGTCLRRNARRLSRDCHSVVFAGGPRRATHRTYRRHHHH